MYKCSCYLRCLLLNKTSLAFLETFNILNIVSFKPRYITSQKHKQIPYVLFGNGTINSLFFVYVRHEVVERALNLAIYYKQRMWISPRFLFSPRFRSPGIKHTKSTEKIHSNNCLPSHTTSIIKIKSKDPLNIFSSVF